MKIIDLINNIAQKQPVPDKILYKGEIYTYTVCGDMIGYKVDNGGWLNYWMNNLNDEVQAIKSAKNIIEIDIYSIYKVMKSVSSSKLSEDNQTIYDNMFIEDENSNIFLINGAKLLEEFSYYLKDDYLQDLVIQDDTIKFSIFNYNTGESEDISYTIISREVKDEK